MTVERRADLCQGIFRDRQILSHDFAKALPAAGDQQFTLSDKSGIEESLVEIPSSPHRGESFIDNKLSQSRIAENMPLRRCVERFGIQHPDNKAEVKIAVYDRSHVGTTNFAKVSLVAFSHGRKQRVKVNDCEGAKV